MNTRTKMSVPMRHLLLTSVATIALATMMTQNLKADEGQDSPFITESLPSVDTASLAPNEDEGFSISVDGEVVAGSGTLEDTARKSDVALATADIQIKFDGLGVKPQLNVSTLPATTSYEPGQSLNFQISLNYGSWIERAEIVVFQNGNEHLQLAELTVDNKGRASWNVPNDVNGRLSYILRVHDSAGNIDETHPLVLLPSAPDKVRPDRQDNAKQLPVASTVLSEDRTSVRNIPVYGGAVTIYGRDIDPTSSMLAFGEEVLVDPEGNFVVQRILPPGDHTVQVELRDEAKNTLDFSRNINIPENDWFYVGLADLTLGKRFAKGDLEGTNPSEYKGIYNKGRVAFYLKGKMKGRTILTASLDTTEGNLKSLLKNIDEKDPRAFLKRIDPDDYYPIYGDDSVAVEDAPTSGRFYVRVDRDDSHVMWGNFKAHVTGNKFLKNDRSLYGAQGVYRSKTAAPFGQQRRTEVSGHAASPGTLNQQDNMRGTGGSAYFTKFQDVNQGSESVAIETRDPVTGFVLSNRSLKAGADYNFDYSQGVVILNTPLSTNSGGNPQFLVINYEYTPSITNVKGMVYGGRAAQWLGSNTRVGVTGMRDDSGKSNLELVGADVRVHASEKSYFDVHVAQSKGRGNSSSTSHNGGLTFSNNPVAAMTNGKAKAYGFESRADMEELTAGGMRGGFDLEYAHKEAGFATLDETVLEQNDKARAAANIELTDVSRVKSSVSVAKLKGKKAEHESSIAFEHDVSEKTSVEVSSKHSVKPGSGTTSEYGRRSNVGVKLSHRFDDETSAYVFGEATVHRNGTRRRDNRIGVGGKTAISDQVTLESEASIGSYGPGGEARLNYAPTAEQSYYIGYALDAYRDLDPSSSLLSSGPDLGSLIFGAKTRLNEQVSVYAEDSYDMFGQRKTLSQTYGVDYTPVPEWSFGGALELGNVDDDTVNASSGLSNSDFDRKAVSLSTSYKTEAGDFMRVKGEARQERSEDGTRDMDSYLFQFQSSVKTYEEWRLLMNADVVLSDTTATSRDSEYVEASLGYAYRPTEDDRLNALLKYTFLYDLPGVDQVTSNGTFNGVQQRSHILSADAIYDLTSIVSVGGKYGVRLGDSRPRDGSEDWTNSTAHMGVLRADVNIDRQWEALLEARVLWSPSSDSTHFGAVSALYRHVGENFKVGVGYNFGDFSDDLSDLSLNDHGVFVNAIGKF